MSEKKEVVSEWIEGNLHDVFPHPIDETEGREFPFYVVQSASPQRHDCTDTHYFNNKEMAKQCSGYKAGVYGGWDEVRIIGLNELPPDVKLAEQGDWI